MPPEDAGEKTEAPTPRRRQQARERGQVAKSQDLTAAVALLGAMAALKIAAPGLLHDLAGLMQLLLGYRGPDLVSIDSMMTFGEFAAHVLVWTAGPLCLAFLFVALIVTLGQVGLLFTFHPLKPDIQKIDPISGFGKIFSMQSLMRLLISVFKVLVIGTVAFLTIQSWLPQIVAMSSLDFLQIISLSGDLMYSLGVRLAAALLVLAIIDYIYQKYRHEQSLRMTRQEVKEEMRRQEGDPLVRERRRRVARQLAMQRMQMAVPRADVVVTNPTELAIALKYDPDTMSAPKVVAKGAGFVAQRIRKIAIEHGVPIVERKPLAQAIFKTCEVGQEIPPTFYKAVAEILAYVYELSGRSTAKASAARAAAT